MSSIQRAMDRARKVDGRDRATTGAGAAAGTSVGPLQRHTIDERREGFDIELNLVRLREQGLLTPDADHRDLQEQYRLVKRQLITHAFGDERTGSNPGNLIQITSSLLNEGKTFSAFNLAMSIAMELDYTVLLIDADLTRRSLTGLIGLEERYGITDIIGGTVADVGDCVFRTNVPRLAVIPSGQDHARATELIASADMRRLTRELASRYPDRLVIFDSTPLLMDSQAATLAHHMGQVLVVVEAGKTQQQVVGEAVALLDIPATRVAMLLNKSMRGHGYGYYGAY